MSGRLVRRLILALLIPPALCVLAWGGGLLWFIADLAVRVEDVASTTDSVVVLTGGADRLRRGVELLEAGKGRKLFVSGVHPGVDLPDLLRQVHVSPALAQCCIVLGYAADDTVGNAVETAQWMRREGYSSLRLVTASYHMRRSLLEFRRALPESVIVAHPVFPDAFKWDQWWRRPGTAHLMAVEYTKYLAAAARPLFTPRPPEKKPS